MAVDATEEIDRAPLIAEAILEAEGRCAALHGKSGEYGCFQYQAGTWASYSRQTAGRVLIQTGENERWVTEEMIRKWKAAGKTDRWIFLEWNQGKGDGWGPGTKDCYNGWNDYDVYYDSCAYAQEALDHLFVLETATYTSP